MQQAVKPLGVPSRTSVVSWGFSADTTHKIRMKMQVPNATIWMQFYLQMTSIYVKQARYCKIYMFKSKSRKFRLSTNHKFWTKIKFLSRWIPAWLVVSVETWCNYEVSFYLVIKIPKQYLYFYSNNKSRSVISRKC